MQLNQNNHSLILDCPNCESKISLQTHYRAKNVACGNCKKLFAFDFNQNLQFDHEFKLAKKVKPTFKVGHEFLIESTLYVILGFVIKQESSYNTQWVEYLLFNPKIGVRILNESDGHFTFLHQISYFQENTYDEVVYPINTINKRFDLFSQYKYKIISAEGEFLNKISESSQNVCRDFVNSPYMLSYEKSQFELQWYFGEYVHHSTIESWSQQPVFLPPKEGVAPCQPFSKNYLVEDVYKISFFAVIVLLLVHFVTAGLINKNKVLSSKTYLQADSLRTQTFVSEKFIIDENNVACDFKISSNINNSWVETDFTLINDDNGDQFYFSKALEYYSGYEDGEGWNEGSRDGEVTLSNLKNGTYHFIMTTNYERNMPGNILNITFVQGVTLHSNLLIAIGIALIFPAITYILYRTHKRKQWFNSEYSPYEQ